MKANVTTKRALFYVREIKARQAEYAEECREYAREGLRHPYCIHGKYMWTDYDNICGPCEDSYGVYEIALMQARSDVAEMRKRTDWLTAMPKDVSLPHELRTALIDWAVDPITSGL